jgi:hypothetical protein
VKSSCSEVRRNVAAESAPARDFEKVAIVVFRFVGYHPCIGEFLGNCGAEGSDAFSVGKPVITNRTKRFGVGHSLAQKMAALV